MNAHPGARPNRAHPGARPNRYYPAQWVRGRLVIAGRGFTCAGALEEAETEARRQGAPLVVLTGPGLQIGDPVPDPHVVIGENWRGSGGIEIGG